MTGSRDDREEVPQPGTGRGAAQRLSQDRIPAVPVPAPRQDRALRASRCRRARAVHRKEHQGSNVARLYRRNADGAWWGDWTDATGKRQQRSLRTKDKAVAKARLKQAELGPAAAPRRRSQSLSEALDHMISTTLHDKAEGTREMYEKKARRLLSVLGDPDINDLTRDTLADYVRIRLKGGDTTPIGSPGTVLKELITLRKTLNEASDRGLLVLPVAALMPKFKAKYKPKERWLSIDEFERLAGELEPDRALWASLAALAGIRAGEVERLEWGMVNFAGDEVRVPGTKTAGSRRTVPLAPALRARLEGALQGGADFSTARVVAHWTNVRRDLHAACARAGLAPVSPNDLRRSFASWLKQAGVDSAWVAALMGHASTRMVDLVYGKLTQETLRQAMRSIPVPTIVTPPCHPVAHPDPLRLGSVVEADGVFLDENPSEIAVPRDGVEPPTRGFSVPCEGDEDE